MNILQAIFLGIVQGLCEFLPVSSSGHLVLFQSLLGVEEGGLLFTTFLHLGTLVAVVAVYYKDLWQMLRHPVSKPVRLLVVATLPAVVFTLALHNIFDDAFAGRFLGISFLLTFLILFFGSRFAAKRQEVIYKDAAAMGLWQAVAILPGISRSGATISGGSMMGLSRESAAKFSFLMSIPAILGSLVFQVKDIASGQQLEIIGIWPLLLGFLAAALSGYFAIRFMLRLLQKTSLRAFGWYTLVIGILVLCDQLFFNVFFVKMF